MPLSSQEQDRYSRQIVLPEVGIFGQETLLSSRVAVVGAGALGSVVCEILVRTGVLHLTIIDRDIIETSNLQRQALYDEKDVGSLKVAALHAKLGAINSLALNSISAHAVHLHSGNIEEILLKTSKECDFDLIIDCSDNVYVRRLLDVFRLTFNVPLLFGSVVQNKGLCALLDGPQVSLDSFLPTNAQGESCSQAGVFGSASHFVASVQSHIALLHLLGKLTFDVSGSLLSLDLSTFSIRKFALKQTDVDRESLEYPESSRVMPFCRGVFQVLSSDIVNLDLVALQKKLVLEHENVRLSGQMLLCGDHRIFADGRALISQKSKELALKVYDSLIRN